MSQPDADRKPTRAQRVYGYAFAAGRTYERNLMNAGRIEALERGLNGLARKVLELVPIQESWSTQQIFQQSRRDGHSLDFRVIEGALKNLADQGLLKRTVIDNVPHFQRVKKEAAEAGETTPIPRHMLPSVPAPVVEGEGGIDRVLRLVDAVSVEVEQLSAATARLKGIAEQLEKAALELSEEAGEAAAGIGKLRQLKELLASV